ncbi:MAG TPA: SDR family NAD(P)-dependent oxidoreductase, partial [Spirochaetes bacterium]|nr:SDR family NAD(P)-dependent oxidoreductase [Spirochaetota bacterium]
RVNQQAADRVVDEIKSHGVKGIAVKADLSIETDILRLFNTVDQQLGPITALVNNAGILEQQMWLDEMTSDRLNRIFTVNITGSFLCAREAVKRMSTRYGGRWYGFNMLNPYHRIMEEMIC